MTFRINVLLLCGAGFCTAQTLRFAEHSIQWSHEHVAGLALDGRTLVTWGDRLLRRSLPQGALQVLREPGRAFSESGCLLDVDGDGQREVVVNEGDELVWFRAPRWTRHVIATGVDAADLLPATLLGRRGVLLIQKRMQVRFYEVPAHPTDRWPSRDLYSVYTPSWQGGLALADIDGDGRPDILCGNYWIRSPQSFELPWRLFAINTWTETEKSGMMRLVYRARVLFAAQREMEPARLAWFEKPADPKQLWEEHRIGIAPGLSQPNSLEVADFDGDGRPDILVAEKAGLGRLIIFRNEGAGRYSPQVIAQTAGVQHARAGDLNGDGRPDLLVIGKTSISWWENRWRPPETR